MRELFTEERPIVEFLLQLAGIEIAVGSIRVTPIDDGGMGSLLIGGRSPDRRFGSQAAECEFVDADGVAVSATLNLDDRGELFELDMWRVDFKPLKAWPTPDQLRSAAAAV